MSLPWIQTISNKAFTPTAPNPDDILIKDIAWSLSMQCRFNGHVRRFYSVAEHCWHMSRMVSPEAALWALLHDAGEAYVSDVASPLKPLVPALVQCENRILDLVVFKWCPDLTPQAQEEVDICDKWIVHEEAKILMGKRPQEWFPQPHFEPLTPMPDRSLIGAGQRWAYIRFLNRFRELTGLETDE